MFSALFQNQDEWIISSLVCETWKSGVSYHSPFSSWQKAYQTLHKKMKFSIKDFFSKCDKLRIKLHIWWRLLKKSLMENFIFCVVRAWDSSKDFCWRTFLFIWISTFNFLSINFKIYSIPIFQSKARV